MLPNFFSYERARASRSIISLRGRRGCLEICALGMAGEEMYWQQRSINHQMHVVLLWAIMAILSLRASAKFSSISRFFFYFHTCTTKCRLMCSVYEIIHIWTSVVDESDQYHGGHGFESCRSPYFFRLLLSSYLNWKIYRDDHDSSLSLLKCRLNWNWKM